MSENTRHTVRVTTCYRDAASEAALWLIWRLCALPVWATRVAAAFVAPYVANVPEYVSMAVRYSRERVAEPIAARVAEVRQRPTTTYVGIVALVVGLAIFSGLIGHVA
jgi:hypothetical protein